MPAYWVAHVNVTDPEIYKNYSDRAPAALGKYGAKFLARGGETHSLEGDNRARNVVIEFPSVQDALDCYNSAEYQAAVKIRQNVADSELIIVEGVE